MRAMLKYFAVFSVACVAGCGLLEPPNPAVELAPVLVGIEPSADFSAISIDLENRAGRDAFVRPCYAVEGLRGSKGHLLADALCSSVESLRVPAHGQFRVVVLLRAADVPADITMLRVRFSASAEDGVAPTNSSVVVTDWFPYP